ncbi:MAG TPA: hypothetical protein VM686_38350 [Polyangiaceae bacterium]|nr:hypothetical protein [Polyangiaceae bacterium]
MSLVPPNHAPGEEELEELGDDVIIAQQTLAHAPPAAAQVEDEKRSVVISDKPPGEAKRSHRPRSRGEATVVIRDRRKVEAMRREILESQRAFARMSSKPPRPYLVWGGAALAAFVLGGVVALVVGAATTPSPALIPSAPTVDPAAAERAKAKDEPKPAPAPTVNLEDLPIERKRR